ncbi:MAG: ATP-binding cassette domain-containing protein, partial [Rhodospirillales bacterium]|nr:ATP-binding cassette domain-containing protein [Rhodospirillales bacterium]
KSSMARMLLGLVPTDGGKIRIGGADILGWPAESLGPHLGYVPQAIELIPATVRENIARFTDSPVEKVIEAAKQAGIHELILRLPQGYDTPVGGVADRLPAGLRQRIALARALFGNPTLVVLDEPYSNLDAGGIAGLTEALGALKRRGAITVIIAHRPSILALADKVLSIRDGVGRMMGRTGKPEGSVLPMPRKSGGAKKQSAVGA